MWTFIVRLCCVATLTITGIVFTGYALNDSNWNTLIFDNVPMAFTTALGLTLLSVGTIILTFRK